MTPATGPRACPPSPTPRLLSRAFIRASLRRVTGAREVADDAVQAVVAALERRFQESLAVAAEGYQRDLLARSIHGAYPRGILRESHLRSTGGSVKSPESFRGAEAVTRAAREVTHEKDAPEVG